MRRQLGQVRPANTSATVLFQPLDSTPYNIDLIHVANVGTTTIEVSVFHDRDGTTYDATTALLWQSELLPKGMLQFEMSKGIADYLKEGRVAVQTNVANSATFTCYGEIEGERV
jgi:hypothetical protein